MWLLSVNYVFIVFILKVINMYFKRLKLVVRQQLLFMRFANLEAGIVQFTPNTSCHDAYCQHYFGDQTPNDSRVCYYLLSVGRKVNSHQILSQKYRPVYLYSILRPYWFGAHHLDFGPQFRSIRGWKLCPFSKKKHVTFSENEFLSCDY